MTMTRRSFLESLGRVGGSALVMAGMEAFGMSIASAASMPPPLQGGGKGKRVVILGAGVAGLTSAYELSRAGYDVTVIEARAFAGGRSQTARKGFQLTELGGTTQTCDFDEGLYINHGPWRIPFHQRSTLHYIKEFGVEVELFNNDNDNSYAYFTQGTGPLANKRIRKREIAADARGHAAELLAKSVQSGALDQQFSAADKEQFLSYLSSEGWLSGPGHDYKGTDGRGWIVKPGAGLIAGEPSVPYSLTDVLHSDAWKILSSVSEWDQQRTMFQPKGGMFMLPMGFVKHVGKLIRYSTVVEKIRQNDAGVEVSVVDGKGQRSTVKGDWCICTIPLSVLKGIDNGLSDAHKMAMNGISYAPVGKIGLQMKRRFWEEDEWIYGGHIYTDDQSIGSVSLPSTGWLGRKGVLLGYYNFAGAAAKMSALSPADRAKAAVAFGEKVFPQNYASNFETAFSVAWHRVQYNLGGWGVWSEEARARDYPVLLQPDNRIYLAGEHLSHLGGWQAGGIESAWMQIDALHKRASA
jgi:monoamine oxidase